MPNLYNPSDFASYSALFGYATILAAILSFKSEFVITPNSGVENTESDYALSAYITTFTFLISLVVFIIIGFSSTNYIFAIVPIIAYGIAMQNILKMRTIGYGGSDNFYKHQIISAILRGAFVILLSAFGRLGLLLGEILSRLIFIRPNKIYSILGWVLNVRKGEISRLSSLGFYGTLISFTDAIIINAMYVLPLHIAASSRNAAIIALAARVGSLPISLIGIPMGDYIYSSYGHNLNDFKKRVTFLVVAALFGGISILLFSFLYERYYLTSSFSGLTEVIVILLPMIIIQILYNSVSRFIFLFDLMKLKLATDISQIILIGLFYFFGDPTLSNLAIFFMLSRLSAYLILLLAIFRSMRLKK